MNPTKYKVIIRTKTVHKDGTRYRDELVKDMSREELQEELGGRALNAKHAHSEQISKNVSWIFFGDDKDGSTHVKVTVLGLDLATYW